MPRAVAERLMVQLRGDVIAVGPGWIREQPRRRADRKRTDGRRYGCNELVGRSPVESLTDARRGRIDH